MKFIELPLLKGDLKPAESVFVNPEDVSNFYSIERVPEFEGDPSLVCMRNGGVFRIALPPHAIRTRLIGGYPA